MFDIITKWIDLADYYGTRIGGALLLVACVVCSLVILLNLFAAVFA